MEQGLSGVKVLDFGHYIAGPYTAMLLAEQGAEVIKVERPDGDPFRKETGFIVWNRSKKGMTLDLKKAEGQRIAQELAKGADVVIENFHPGVADRLGIGYDTLRQLNPRLVYCSISGFGQSGPYRDMPGWDPIVATVAGLYAYQGGAGPPLYLVMPMPSYYTALMAAFSTANALLARETTGKGQQVDMSLFNTILVVNGVALVDFKGIKRIFRGDPQGGSPVYKLYQAKDGKWFFLALGNLTFLAKFAVAMGHQEWITDPRFDGAPFLILPPISFELIAMFKGIFGTKTRDEWLEFLRAVDIPCAPALSVEEFMDDPQVLANGMVEVVEQPPLGQVREMGVPLRLTATPGNIRGPAPTLGQHNQEVLGSLGISVRDVSRLKRQGVI